VEELVKSHQRRAADKLRKLADNIDASENILSIEIGEHHLECEFLLRIENGVRVGKITFESTPE